LKNVFGIHFFNEKPFAHVFIFLFSNVVDRANITKFQRDGDLKNETKMIKID
jgi:hypothetical protein